MDSIILKIRENQRILPSLSEKGCSQQVIVEKAAGFTLVELMAVLAILGVLLGIAGGAWMSLREDNIVRTAAGTLRTALVQARTEAYATGVTQYVGIDMANDRLTTSADQGSVYDVSAASWDTYSQWRNLDGADVLDSKTGGAPPASPISGVKTIKFLSNGTARVTAGSAYSVRVNDKNSHSDVVNILVITRNTGRVHVKECTVSRANSNNC